MSLLRKDDVYEGRNANSDGTKLAVTNGKPDLGFILVLICAALAITVATALFAPAPGASQIASDTLIVGP